VPMIRGRVYLTIVLRFSNLKTILQSKWVHNRLLRLFKEILWGKEEV